MECTPPLWRGKNKHALSKLMQVIPILLPLGVEYYLRQPIGLRRNLRNATLQARLDSQLFHSRATISKSGKSYAIKRVSSEGVSPSHTVIGSKSESCAVFSSLQYHVQ